MTCLLSLILLLCWRLIAVEYDGSLPEEGLAQWAIALVALIEPLADAGNVELIATVTARQGRQATVCTVQNTEADVALFDAFHLVIDVSLPEEDSTDDVAVARLDEVAD